MTPYARRFVSDYDFALFQKIRNAVSDLPDIGLGTDEAGKRITLNCHILARAVGDVCNLTVVDGRFFDGWAHSWLLLPAKHVIDVYPVGMLDGPILVEGSEGCSPARFWYRKTEESWWLTLPSFHNAVKKVTAEFERVFTTEA